MTVSKHDVIIIIGISYREGVYGLTFHIGQDVNDLVVLITVRSTFNFL